MWKWRQTIIPQQLYRFATNTIQIVHVTGMYYWNINPKVSIIRFGKCIRYPCFTFRFRDFENTTLFQTDIATDSVYITLHETVITISCDTLYPSHVKHPIPNHTAHPGQHKAKITVLATLVVSNTLIAYYEMITCSVESVVHEKHFWTRRLEALAIVYRNQSRWIKFIQYYDKLIP